MGFVGMNVLGKNTGPGLSGQQLNQGGPAKMSFQPLGHMKADVIERAVPGT